MEGRLGVTEVGLKEGGTAEEDEGGRGSKGAGDGREKRGVKDNRGDELGKEGGRAERLLRERFGLSGTGFLLECDLVLGVNGLFFERGCLFNFFNCFFFLWLSGFYIKNGQTSSCIK